MPVHFATICPSTLILHDHLPCCGLQRLVNALRQSSGPHTHVLAADDYSASTDSETFDPDATQLGYAPGRRYRDSDSEEEDWPRNRREDDEEYW